MQPKISATMFYSLLFAMGGAPTIAMMIILLQTQDKVVIYPIFIGLTSILACVLVPIILLQNAFLFTQRHSIVWGGKVQPLYMLYLVLNIVCLAFWLLYAFIF
jgi:hypothetical protein